MVAAKNRVTKNMAIDMPRSMGAYLMPFFSEPSFMTPITRLPKNEVMVRDMMAYITRNINQQVIIVESAFIGRNEDPDAGEKFGAEKSH